jgi:DinB superfamily
MDGVLAGLFASGRRAVGRYPAVMDREERGTGEAEMIAMSRLDPGLEALVIDDRPYIRVNDRERDRLREFINGVDDDALAAPANEYWTVAGVLGHLAYWDSRVLVLAEKIDRGEPWVPSDEEPEGDWLNDSTRPIIHAIAPRAAAELALRIAEETDARVAELPLDRMAPLDPESPIWPARGDHRGEHLDELERAVRDRD